MKKTLVALAALAATGAYAQVTIDGFFNGSVDMFSISGRAAGNASETRVSDNTSRINFRVNEDMGRGLSAVGLFELRFPIDQNSRINALCGTVAAQTAIASGAAGATTAQTASTCAVPNPVNSGNAHVGLSSNTLGAIRLGRQDIHYIENGSFNPVGLPTIHNAAGVLNTAAAGAFVGRTSRSANLIWWTSPVVNGLQGTVGYSTNSYAASGQQDGENDLASSQRQGSTTYLRLGYNVGKLSLALSNINEKSDWIGSAATATGVTGAAATQTASGANADRKGTTITAKYDLGVAKLGVAMADNESTAYTGGTMGNVSKRKSTQFGAQLPINAMSAVALTYTKVGNVTTAGTEAAATGATHTTLAYNYDLSKRTQLVVAATQLSNDSSASHGLFYNADNVIGSIGSSANAGEKHKVNSIGLRNF